MITDYPRNCFNSVYLIPEMSNFGPQTWLGIYIDLRFSGIEKNKGKIYIYINCVASSGVEDCGSGILNGCYNNQAYIYITSIVLFDALQGRNVISAGVCLFL